MASTQELDRRTIENARAGDPRAQEVVAARARERVYPYIRRVVLDQHLADDLTQETLARVCKSLGALEQVDCFWGWVMRIASSRVTDHFRTLQRRKTMAPLLDSYSDPIGSHGDAEGYAAVQREELAALTEEAMTEVSEHHRMVLVLRVFEDLPYAEISEMMGISVLGARAMFVRARKSLARALRRRGVTGSSLGAALLAFGQMTRPAEAAAVPVTINAPALKEGVGGLVVAAKGYIAATVALTAGLGVIWAGLGPMVGAGAGPGGFAGSRPGSDESAWMTTMVDGPGQADAAAVVGEALEPDMKRHDTRPPDPAEAAAIQQLVQALHGDADDVTSRPAGRPSQTTEAITDRGDAFDGPVYVHYRQRGWSPSSADKEPVQWKKWLCLPEGSRGPIWMKAVAWDGSGERPLMVLLQNDEATRAYNVQQKAWGEMVYGLPFGRQWITALPTDSLAMARFVAQLEGETTAAMVDRGDFAFARDPQTGWVVWQEDRRADRGGVFEVEYDYSPHPEGTYDWQAILEAMPEKVRRIEARDPLGRQGYAFVRIAGRFDGHAVVGGGRVPFTPAGAKANPPWLRLKMADVGELVDDGRAAGLVTDSGEVAVRLSGESCFKGLPRTWHGLSVSDDIRREAARQRMRWKLVAEPTDRMARIIIEGRHGRATYEFIYTVDRCSGFLAQLEVWGGVDWVFSRQVGKLNFSYLASADKLDPAVAKPRSLGSAGRLPVDEPSLLWPMLLVEYAAENAATAHSVPAEGQALEGDATSGRNDQAEGADGSNA